MNSWISTPWVLIPDAADALNVPEQTIRTWIRREQVTASTDHLGRLVVWWTDCHERQYAHQQRRHVRDAMPSDTL